MEAEKRRIVDEVERRTQFVFLDDEIRFAEELSKKKIQMCKKRQWYFLLLFRNELENIVMRQEINSMRAV